MSRTVKIRYGLKRIVKADANIRNADWARGAASLPIDPNDPDKLGEWLALMGLTRAQWEKLPASQGGHHCVDDYE